MEAATLAVLMAGGAGATHRHRAGGIAMPLRRSYHCSLRPLTPLHACAPLSGQWPLRWAASSSVPRPTLLSQVVGTVAEAATSRLAAVLLFTPTLVLA
jgi:hypothetical protein